MRGHVAIITETESMLLRTHVCSHENGAGERLGTRLADPSRWLKPSALTTILNRWNYTAGHILAEPSVCV